MEKDNRYESMKRRFWYFKSCFALRREGTLEIQLEIYLDLFLLTSLVNKTHANLYLCTNLKNVIAKPSLFAPQST